MGKDMIELFAFCYMLLREGKFEDIAISGSKSLNSIKNFNSANDVYEYAANNPINELLIRKNGKDKFTERIQLYEINGFRLNRKSVTFKINGYRQGNKIINNYNVRFN